jgi:catechol 2,3-dioxygenase-like lactoylglutathione lyase family enzyme
VTLVAAEKPSVNGLMHISLKSGDVPTTVSFYRDLLGMIEVDRPPFDFPGAWLACPPPANGILVHLYGGDTALDKNGNVPVGSGAIDHVAIGAVGFHKMRDRLIASGKGWRQNIPPKTTIWQLFVNDPNGVLIELNYDGASEGGTEPTPENGPWYNAREHF